MFLLEQGVLKTRKLSDINNDDIHHVLRVRITEFINRTISNVKSTCKTKTSACDESFTHILNNSGPKTEPCGTPLLES